MQPAPATPDDPAPGDTSAETLEAPPERPAAVVSHPHQIGPYRILECIGEGGMGVVYKGIIHRDLKPTNIHVTLFDGQPRRQGDRFWHRQSDQLRPDAATWARRPRTI